MNESRGHWYLLTGLLLGLALGILYAWLIAPLEYVDTTPASLRADFKDDYRYLIAASYRATGNLERARARLSLLGDPDPVTALGEQAQRLLALNADSDVIQTLAGLAETLQSRPEISDETPLAASPQAGLPLNQATQTPESNPVTPLPTDIISPFEPILPPTETSTAQPTLTATATLPRGARTATATRTPRRSPTPIATATPRPSLTPTATPGQPFQLIEQTTFCDAQRPGLLQIRLQDASGTPASGIELTITWLGGEETFFSGLKPELGFGYADFEMTPGIEYALSLSGGITRLTGLQASTCTDSSAEYPGGIQLLFRQP